MTDRVSSGLHMGMFLVVGLTVQNLMRGAGHSFKDTVELVITGLISGATARLIYLADWHR